MGRARTQGDGWPYRALRAWWPDRNPLRRRWDRIEAAVAAVLIAVFLAGAPLAGVFAGRWAHDASVRIQHAQRAGLHQENAVLLARAPHSALAAYGGYALPQVRARWPVPGGGHRVGEVYASPGAPAGSTVQVWVGRSGAIAAPPLRARQVTGQVVLASILAPSALLLLLVGAWLLARRSLDRRRLAAWEAGWRATGPSWTSLR